MPTRFIIPAKTNTKAGRFVTELTVRDFAFPKKNVMFAMLNQLFIKSRNAIDLV